MFLRREIGWPKIYDGCRKNTEKKANPSVDCSKCKLKCTEKIEKSMLEEIFKSYYDSKHTKGRKNSSADMLQRNKQAHTLDPTNSLHKKNTLSVATLQPYTLPLSDQFDDECFIMLDKPLYIVADFYKLNMEVYMHFVTPQICNRICWLSATVCFNRLSNHSFLATLILSWTTQIS